MTYSIPSSGADQAGKTMEASAIHRKTTGLRLVLLLSIFGAHMLAGGSCWRQALVCGQGFPWGWFLVLCMRLEPISYYLVLAVEDVPWARMEGKRLALWHR